MIIKLETTKAVMVRPSEPAKKRTLYAVLDSIVFKNGYLRALGRTFWIEETTTEVSGQEVTTKQEIRVDDINQDVPLSSAEAIEASVTELTGATTVAKVYDYAKKAFVVFLISQEKYGLKAPTDWQEVTD